MSLTPNMSKKSCVQGYYCFGKSAQRRLLEDAQSNQSRKIATMGQSSASIQPKTSTKIIRCHFSLKKYQPKCPSKAGLSLAKSLQPCPAWQRTGLFWNMPFLVSFRVHVRTQVSSWRTRQAEKEKKMVQEGLQSKETLGPKLQAPALFGGLYFCLGIFNKNVYQRSTYLFH